MEKKPIPFQRARYLSFHFPFFSIFFVKIIDLISSREDFRDRDSRQNHFCGNVNIQNQKYTYKYVVLFLRYQCYKRLQHRFNQSFQ